MSIRDEAEEAWYEYREARPEDGPTFYLRRAFIAAYVAGRRSGEPIQE